MKVHKLRVDKDLIYTEDEEEIVRCPICGEVWMEGDEHMFYTDCPHLRFVYIQGSQSEFITFWGDWDPSPLEEEFMKLLETEDEIDAFKRMKYPAVNRVAYHRWDDFPLFH